MTTLTPGMRIQVTTVYADISTAATVIPRHAEDGYQPYTGPGTWKLYGYTGTKGRAQPPYSDVCACNECALDPAVTEQLRQKTVSNIGSAGRFAECTRSYRCAKCRRSKETDVIE
jgi:hypothetical protein